MKTPGEPGAKALSRRHLLQAAGTGVGALALVGAGFAAAPHLTGAVQIDATPPAPPHAATSTGPDPIAGLAARLNYDAEAIFAFVQGEIGYEAYSGVLRGAKGTLWARAGNAADQAVLLGELLAASQIPYRFTIGPLDGPGLEALGTELMQTAESANGRYERALAAAASATSGSGEAPSTPDALSPADQQAMERLVGLGEEVIAAASRSTEISGTAIAEALAAVVSLPALPAATLPDRERDAHAWVQISDGPQWINLDPSISDTAFGVTWATPSTFFDTFPDDWFHAVTVSIAADDYAAGALSRRDVVSVQTTSHRTVNAPIAINIAPAEAIAGLGGSITQLFSGQLTMIPSIFADGVSTDASQPLIFSTNGSTAVGALDAGSPVIGAGEGETVAVWLTVTIASPDAAPVLVERAVLDRVPVSARASGVIDPTAITPIATTPSAFERDELDTVDEFNSLTVIAVDVGRIPNAYALADAASDQVVGAVRVFGPSLAALRDGLGIVHETAAGVWSYPSGPNVTAFAFRTSPSADSPGLGRMAIDLLHRQRVSLPLRDVQPDGQLHPLVLSGVLDAVAEQTLLHPAMLDGEVGDVSVATSIGAIFETARESGVPIRLLATVDQVGAIEANEASTLMIAGALESGMLVVVPEQPVDLEGGPVSGWWIIDPASGRTFDQLQDGRSSASGDIPVARGAARAGDTMPFYARWTAWMAENAKTLNCVGSVVGAVAGVAVMVINFTGSQSQALYGVGAASTLGNLAKIPNACL